MVHAFADCELDEDLFQVRRRGKLVKLEPKVFDVLAYLLRHRDRVVSKDELLDAVWAGHVVSESVLPKCITAARRAVGDDRSRRKVIETVHGRGYRFVAVVAEPAVPAPAQAPATPQPPLVGREKILQRLRAGLDAARDGRGRLFMLAGEPGIGKTRTAEAFAAEAQQRDALVLFGRAYEGEGAPPFWPWIQILRACLKHIPPEALATDLKPAAAALATLLPDLSRPAGDLVPLPPLEGHHARFRLFDSVSLFLKHVSSRRTLVLVLDDLHWADDASLRLLHFLAATVGDGRLVVVGTYRDVEVRRTHPLHEILTALARESSCERLALRGLSADDTEALITAISDGPAARLASAVHEMTEGNPFFIHEIVRWLDGDGRRVAGEAHAPLQLALPQSVRDAIGRRLSALSAGCNRLLHAAAVLGREFDATCLARMADRAAERVLDDLTEAVHACIVDERSDRPGHYAFHHALIHQTLYDELSTPERVRLHGRAGAALEDIAGPAEQARLDQLAHHFFQAAAGGSATKAVDLCVRAAERAYRGLAYEQSARQYQNALDVFPLQPERDQLQRCTLLLALGESQQAAGTRDAARASFEQAAEIARQAERVDLLARAALGYRGPAEMGTYPEATTLALLEEAVARVGSGHSPLRARLLSRLVGTPPYANSMERRDALSHEALAIARQTGDLSALRDALSARLWACLGPDRIDERLIVARELLDLAAQQHDKRMALLAYEAQFGAELVRGDMTAADRALESYTRTAHDLRQPAFVFQAIFFQGSRALARGEIDTAEQCFRRALERGRGVVPYAHFMFAGQMVGVVYLRGETPSAELQSVFFGEMMALPYSWEPAMHSALAYSLLLRGERDGAQRELDALAARGIETLPRDEHWLVTMGSLSSVAVLLGDRPRAAMLYDLLAPYADLVVVHDLLRSVGSSVASELGNLATGLERYDVAEAHFERALAKETAMGTKLALLETHTRRARLLLQRNRSGDRARAESILDDTRTQMAALGISPTWLQSHIAG